MNPTYIEAAILSFRNVIVKEVLEELIDTNEGIKKHLSNAMLASTKNNNIKGAELLIKKGADINTKNIINLKKEILF